MPLSDYFLNPKHILTFKRSFLKAPGSLLFSSCTASCSSLASPYGALHQCQSSKCCSLMLGSIAKLSQCLKQIPRTVEGSLCCALRENGAEQIPDLKEVSGRERKVVILGNKGRCLRSLKSLKSQTPSLPVLGPYHSIPVNSCIR